MTKCKTTTENKKAFSDSSNILYRIHGLSRSLTMSCILLGFIMRRNFESRGLVFLPERMFSSSHIFLGFLIHLRSLGRKCVFLGVLPLVFVYSASSTMHAGIGSHPRDPAHNEWILRTDGCIAFRTVSSELLQDA